MSDRLISAEATKRVLLKFANEKIMPNSMQEKIIDELIGKIPTAYDVDKKIKQIEEIDILEGGNGLIKQFACPYGYVECGFYKDKPLIFNLYVNPEDRRKGNAKRLLNMAIKYFAEIAPGEDIYIQVQPREESISVEDLREFYKSLNLKILEI